MPFKITGGETTKRPKIPLISLKKGYITIVGEPGKNNLIAGFNVTIGNKKFYYPVEHQNYMSTWNRIYNKIKLHL
jgi:hypothetical protein